MNRKSPTAIILILLIFFCGCGQKDAGQAIPPVDSMAFADTLVSQVPPKEEEPPLEEPPAPSERAFQPPAPEDELSLEEAKWRAVGRYTPRGLGYSPEDMWQKTDYLDLNATGTFTSYMEAGGLMIGRSEKYVSGTWEVVSAKDERITLRAEYIEDEVFQRESLWTLRGKELSWQIGDVWATYARD